jgi:RimJ/RimL family protein N-acetyltransferase
VLNQNVSATSAVYSDRAEETRLVLGPRYALLRREFNVWANWQREVPRLCHHLLITMGGSDEGNVTTIAIEGLNLAGVRDLEATVIVGGSNPNFEKLHDVVARSGLKIALRKDVSNIGELMAAADVAISAGGTTCWELCLLGLPALLIDVADNQTTLATELHKRACAIHIGNRTVRPETIAENLQSLIGSQERRQLLSNNSRELIDGKGAMRVVSLLRGQPDLRLRPVRDEDRRLLWEWANDPEVRAASFVSDPIQWEAHVSWFEAKLADSREAPEKCRMFIAEDEEGAAVGQIRFELRADEGWNVGVSLCKDMRGRGLATGLIEKGVRELLKRDGGSPIHAYVKPENVASLKAFKRARFQTLGTGQVRSHAAIHLIYR